MNAAGQAREAESFTKARGLVGLRGDKGKGCECRERFWNKNEQGGAIDHVWKMRKKMKGEDEKWILRSGDGQGKKTESWNESAEFRIAILQAACRGLGGLWRWESVLTLGTEELLENWWSEDTTLRVWFCRSGLGPATCIFNIYPASDCDKLVLEPYFEKCIDNKDL